MIPTVLACHHTQTAAAVDMALETGRTIIFPTDTIYCIGGNPWDGRTLAHVRRLKRCTSDQPFTLYLDRVSYISTFAQCTDSMLRMIDQLLPGPYTVSLPAGSGAPPSTVHQGKIGIRVPDHRLFGPILKRPIFGTSVNRDGSQPLNDVTDIIESFSEVDLIITGDVTGVSSTIIDLTEGGFRLIRGILPESVQRALYQEFDR